MLRVLSSAHYSACSEHPSPEPNLPNFSRHSRPDMSKSNSSPPPHTVHTPLLAHSLYQRIIPTSLHFHPTYLIYLSLNYSAFASSILFKTLLSLSPILIIHAALAWKPTTIHSVNVTSPDWSSYLQCGLPFNSLSI